MYSDTDLMKRIDKELTTPVTNWTVVWRNYGHWDVRTPVYGRIFRIRGGPGKYLVIDERPESLRKAKFECATVSMAMAYICETLMFELIIAEGQEPHIIEKWNV